MDFPPLVIPLAVDRRTDGAIEPAFSATHSRDVRRRLQMHLALGRSAPPADIALRELR
jgi:hypothetical protein